MFATVKKLWNNFSKRFGAPTGTGSSWWSAFVGNNSSSGVPVTERNALGISPVARAIQILCSIVASMPLEVYEKDGEKSRRLTDHPLSFLLSTQPSKLYSSFKFRYQLMYNLLIHGNGIAHIRRNPNAEPYSIRVINPNSVGCFVDEYLEEVIYQIYQEGIVPSEDVIHISGMGYDGVVGYNPLFTSREELGLNIATRDAKSMAYANGAHPSGVLEHEGKPLSDAGYQRLKNSFQQSYAGIENMGSTVILEGGVKFKAVGYTLNDMAMPEVDAMNIANVARMFGVPLHLLEALQKATLNNVHELTLQFLKFTITPLTTMIEQEFNRKVFRSDELGRMCVRFDHKSFERADTKTQLETLQIAVRNGIFTINEARAMVGLNPVEGGDINKQQMQMTDITQSDNIQENETTKEASSTSDTTEPAVAA